MKRKELAEAIRSVADRGGGFGTNTEQALRALAAALDALPDQSIESAFAALRATSSRSLGSAKPPASKALDSAVVDHYVSRLSASFANPGRARQIVVELAADKRVRRDELFAVAKKVSGDRSQPSNRIAAINRLNGVFDREVLDALRKQQIASS